jgi:hypothetical protein
MMFGQQVSTVKSANRHTDECRARRRCQFDFRDQSSNVGETLGDKPTIVSSAGTFDEPRGALLLSRRRPNQPPQDVTARPSASRLTQKA